jgi:hypothetical protein
LNGYSTPTDREGAQKNIRIFLASSAELKTERDQFEIFIYRENQRLYQNGIFIELVRWEHFIDAMSKTRLQDEYNHAVKNADIFVSLFFTKVGKYNPGRIRNCLWPIPENRQADGVYLFQKRAYRYREHNR